MPAALPGCRSSLLPLPPACVKGRRPRVGAGGPMDEVKVVDSTQLIDPTVATMMRHHVSRHHVSKHVHTPDGVGAQVVRGLLPWAPTAARFPLIPAPLEPVLVRRQVLNGCDNQRGLHGWVRVCVYVRTVCRAPPSINSTHLASAARCPGHQHQHQHWARDRHRLLFSSSPLPGTAAPAPRPRARLVSLSWLRPMLRALARRRLSIANG